MLKRVFNRSLRSLSLPVFSRAAWGAVSLTFIFLLIEFFDELHYGIDGAVLPALRADLALTYAQVGLLLGLPNIISVLIEPVLMLLGDTSLRKKLVLGGGLAIAVSLALIAWARSFPVILFAFILGFPASGAFVTLAQATLMDLNPGREPHLMARWTVAGSLGNLLGPLLVSAGFALALGWRWVFVALAVFALGLILVVSLQAFPSQPRSRSALHEDALLNLKQLLFNLKEAIRSRQLLRWILLLQLADLLMDVFTGYVALYFTDVVGMTPAQASLLLGVLMFTSLVADLLLIPLLEGVPGRQVIRTSAAFAIVVFTAWLLAPWPLAKVILLVAIRLSTLGWYPVLQGEAYASLSGRSGTVMALSSFGGLLSGGLAWLIGWVAGIAGLPAAMWLLLLGPLSLVLFVPKKLR